MAVYINRSPSKATQLFKSGEVVRDEQRKQPEITSAPSRSASSSGSVVEAIHRFGLDKYRYDEMGVGKIVLDIRREISDFTEKLAAGVDQQDHIDAKCLADMAWRLAQNPTFRAIREAREGLDDIRDKRDARLARQESLCPNALKVFQEPKLRR